MLANGPSRSRRTSLVSQRLNKANSCIERSCEATKVSSKLEPDLLSGPHLSQVVPLTSEVIDEKIRALLSGTHEESSEAIEAIYTASSQKASIELFIVKSGVPPLIRQACRDQELIETSTSVKLLFHLFLDSHQVDIVDKLVAVCRMKAAPLEQKNSLRILLSFLYIYPLPDTHSMKAEISEAIKGFLLLLLRNLWYGASHELAHTLECLSFIAITPKFHGPLVILVEQPLPKPTAFNPPPLSRASTYLSVADEQSSPPKVSRWNSFRKSPSKLVDAGMSKLKDLIAPPKFVMQKDGVQGLVNVATRGTLSERELVTAIVAEFAQNTSNVDVQTMCRGFSKAIVSRLSCAESSDIQKIQAITCIEKLVDLDSMLFHFLESGLSPELYLMAQLAKEGPRHHAERLLGKLLEKPNVREFFSAPE